MSFISLAVFSETFIEQHDLCLKAYLDVGDSGRLCRLLGRAELDLGAAYIDCRPGSCKLMFDMESNLMTKHGDFAEVEVEGSLSSRIQNFYSTTDERVKINCRPERSWYGIVPGSDRCFMMIATDNNH